MQNEEQANLQELHSCYASEDEMSKEIWKEIEKKLFDEFMNEFTKCWQEMFPGLSK